MTKTYDPALLYDVVYHRHNDKNIVVAAMTFREGISLEQAGDLADDLGNALRLKPGSWPHSWLTVMPTENDEGVFIVESNMNSL